jgi:small-conductance mechanosensitive channel
MSDSEKSQDLPHEEEPIPEETAPEGITKQKKKWEFTPARRAALEKAHKKRSEKAEEKKRLKKQTEKKALEIIEDRRLDTSAEDDKLDHILYQMEKIQTHIKEKNVPEKLKPPPLRRSRKKVEPPPEDSEITETDELTEDYYDTTETESTRPPPRRKKNPPPVRSEYVEEPKINIMFG